METLILPGFSLKNRDWAYGAMKYLPDSSVVEWRHWTTGNTDFENWMEWVGGELSLIFEKIKEERINLLAKSIGTFAAMNVLKEKPGLVNKLVVAGIPLGDLDQKDKTLYEILGDFAAEDLLCVQNEGDHHGSFDDVKAFLQVINPKIKIIPKPRNDHEYPYFEEFRKFLG